MSAGGTATGVVVSGGVQDVFGTAISTTVMSGVDSGGTHFSGIQVVESGGVASLTVLSDGGYANVSGGGTALGITVSNGGVETVSSGGTDLGAQISGGEQDVFGYASGATVFTGSQVVESGGSTSSTTIMSGGVELVSASGTAIGSVTAAAWRSSRPAAGPAPRLS